METYRQRLVRLTYGATIFMILCGLAVLPSLALPTNLKVSFFSNGEETSSSCNSTELRPCEASKYVVSLRPVGGLGDRLRPLILGFYLAALTDRSGTVDF